MKTPEPQAKIDALHEMNEKLCTAIAKYQGRQETLTAERDEARAELESAVSQIAVLRDERDALAVEVGRLHGAWDCDGETHGPWCREWRKMEAEAGRLRSALAPATMTKLEAREVLSRCDSGYQQCAKCPALACCDNDAGRALLRKGGGT